MAKTIDHKPTVRPGVPFPLQFALMVAALSIGGGRTLFAGESPTKAAQIESSKKSASMNGRKVPLRHPFPPPPLSPNVDLPREPFNSFFPDPNVPEGSKELQKNIAEVLRRLSTPYPSRIAHFAWLNTNPDWQKFGVRLAGWNGMIVKANELADNVWIAKVHVRPCTVAAGRSLVYDYVEEVYRYQNGKLILIETDAGVPKPDKQRLALH
ncbi:hypothetical protein V5E97_19080 [Singulisphaera sp. Ch08]|uniref:Uncharacterized protein n=1 Tax=Singulisphaera sp. Ch08 TaxID=3120278 RepID=A0AAU7CSP5_9BACT